jgi:hypothetical protein
MRAFSAYRANEVRRPRLEGGDASVRAWLEFEHTEQPPGHDPADDFANVKVSLLDGRQYALNVWTFRFLHRVRYPWPYEPNCGQPAEYVVAPDLFVERLDRATLERVVRELLADGEMRKEWLCPPDVEGDDEPPSN